MTKLKRKTGIMAALLLLICTVLTSSGQKTLGVTADYNDNTTPEVLYGTGYYPYNLITIDTETGAGSLVGPTGTKYFVWGLEFDPRSDTLYGVTNDPVDVFGNSQLLRIDRTTGTATPIGGLVGSRVDCLAYDPTGDRLYGCEALGDDLVVIDTSTGAGIVIGSTGFPNLQGLAFNPLDDKLYSVGRYLSYSALIRIEPSTGIGTTVAPIDSRWADIRGLSFDRSGTLYGVWDAANGTSCLLTINSLTGQVSYVGPIGFGVQGLAFVYPVSKPVHNVDTSLDYTTIQQTIDAPETLNGHTIVVDAGTYNENVRINKRLNIVSKDGPSVTTVNATNSTQGVFYLNAVNNVSISGFTITGTSTNAVYLFKANNTRISNNNASNNYVGIFLESSSTNTIVNNTANSNSGAGIYLNTSSNNTISENNVRGNYIGIVVRVNSKNNTLHLNNVASNNRYGIYLFTSSGNSLTENNSTANVRDGIVLDNSPQNNLIANSLMQNGRYGIVFIDSSNNTIYHNNLVNNTMQVYDMSWNSSAYSPSMNVWDNGYPSGGNYWNDYPPTELYYDDGGQETTFWFTNPGGIAAVRFTPPMTGIIRSCRLYARDISYDPYNWDDEVIVKVHVLDANMQDMITPFSWSIAYETWYYVNLTKYGITINTDFYIGIECTGGYTQRFRLNADTNSPDGRSWYYLNGIWTQWNIGDYMIRATVGAGMDNNLDGIGDTPYVIDVNNQDRFPLMVPWITTVRDVAITNVVPFKTVVGQGYTTNINVTATNQGDFTEIFNVTVYANTTAVETQEITLTSENSTTIIFTWNTTGFVYGNYTLSAVAEPVKDETNTANNNYTCNIPIHVGVPGNVSGGVIVGVYDGIVNMRDVAYLVIRFNSRPSSNNWNPNADINNDATVNMRDISIAILNFNRQE